VTGADPLLQRFLRAVQQSWADGTFVRLLVTRPADATESAPARRIVGRLIELRGRPHLSLTAREGTQDRTWNLALGEALEWLAGQLQVHRCGALLGTVHRDWQWQPTRNGPRLVTHRPAQTEIPPRVHDQPKASWLGPAARDWLHALGLVDARGRPRPSMISKYHQIERYMEIVSHQARACGWLRTELPSDARSSVVSPRPAEPPTTPLQIADLGCGKGYLTFALWHLLHRVARRPVRVLGIERRSELVQSAQRTAKDLGAEGLEFVCGEIFDCPLPNLDMLVALHACNTATDAALLRGIECQARLILVAPCCHQQVRPQLRAPPLWAPLLRHGLLAERFAEWITDGLRVLFLEWAGYEVKAIEFVSSEHTPKNLLLAAVRRHPPFTDPTRRDGILALKREFGIRHHALDPLLVPEQLAPGAHPRP
jgi:SAM-dependent methyltransferase